MGRRNLEHPASLNPARWQALRQKILTRAGWRCECCGRAAGRFELDHIHPLWQGGDPWAESNLQILARGCHIEKTRREHTKVNPERMAWAAYLAKQTNQGP